MNSNRTAFILWTIVFLIVGVAVVLNLTGCRPKDYQQPTSTRVIEGVPSYVEKFEDGPVVCYVYRYYGISCVERRQ